ncbi:MAG: BPSS1780 family membrane protein [Betaproteobacteria bacterium]|nr:BPSS1780 family membrane protein [Betaproteobacteria bacterium]
MKARVVEGGNGWQWIVGGFGLFRRAPLLWIALTIVLVIMWMVSFVIPVLGPLLFNLLSPVLFAGLMLGCRAVDRGEELELAHLFAGFQNNAASLVTIGGVYLVGTIVVVGIIFLTAGGSMLPTVMQKSPGDLQMMAAALRSMALALMIGLAIYVPLLMLIWFAPLLVVFDNLKPVDAMKASFNACLVNWLPLLIYGLVILVLWFIAAIPLFLGLIVLLPVLICSVYASYKDIFSASAAPAGGGNALLR